jgi:hypothetical protein
MTTTGVAVMLDNAAVDCGDAVTGIVESAPGSGALHAALVVTAHATSGGHPAEVQAFANAPVGEVNGTARFELSTPLAGPITFAGQHIDVSWQVVVTRDSWTPQAQPLASVPVAVLPDGGLAVWARQAAPPPQ